MPKCANCGGKATIAGGCWQRFYFRDGVELMQTFCRRCFKEAARAGTKA